MTTQDKVILIVANQLGLEIDKIKVQDLLEEDLGADSIDMIEMTIALENGFSIEIPFNEENSFRTIGDIVLYINEVMSP